MKLLDNDYVQQIIQKNDLDKEAKEKEDGFLDTLHKVGAYPLCRMLICYLNRKFNWHLQEVEFSSYSAKFNLLFLLFTFDNNKVDEYIKENKNY